MMIEGEGQELEGREREGEPPTIRFKFADSVVQTKSLRPEERR
jgi:hypothetical protein